MRQWSDDPIEALVPSRIARELFWFCALLWMLAWLGITVFLELWDAAISKVRAQIRDHRHKNDGLDVQVLDSMRRNQQPNPATRTGTFLHRRES